MKTRKKTGLYLVFFNVPNGIGYLRLVFMLVAFNYIFSEPLICVALLYIVGLLDMLDGLAARRLNQRSRLGQILDMVLDRIYETSLLIILILVLPKYWSAWMALILIDIASHFALVMKCQIQQHTTHKISSGSMPALLRLYYREKWVLTWSIVFYENLFAWLYFYTYYPSMWIKIIALICVPGFLFKVSANVLQLLYSFKCIAVFDDRHPLEQTDLRPKVPDQA